MCNIRSFLLLPLWALFTLARLDCGQGGQYERRIECISQGYPTHSNKPNDIPQYTPSFTNQIFRRDSNGSSPKFGTGIGIGIVIGVLGLLVVEGFVWIGYRSRRKKQRVTITTRERDLQQRPLPTPSEPLDFRHLEHYAMSTHSAPSPTTSTASLLRIAHRHPDGTWYFSEPGASTAQSHSPRQSFLSSSHTDESGVAPSRMYSESGRMYIQPLSRPQSGIPPVPPLPPMPQAPPTAQIPQDSRSPKGGKPPPTAFNDKYTKSPAEDDGLSTRTGPPPYRG
ncbi:hypothetical protein M422DRAFT_269781 [Sphaerobolus stellatus SS14]|uniref:Uncharacterized protein n=1 Tax=Sphaerobolus stellatus (strain SS14) TaxID=990650 RepID=A0A0C9UUC1_SPHS4|nr:hypothetical protein M422DRAFT_269781 [Sphaerobolus stellatus SS14]